MTRRSLRRLRSVAIAEVIARAASRNRCRMRKGSLSIEMTGDTRNPVKPHVNAPTMALTSWA